MEARDFRDGDLRLLLELAQELWREAPREVECTFGQIAFWSAQLLHSDWAARLWFDGGRLVGWGWLTRGGELELQTRPSHGALLDEILDWGRSRRSSWWPRTTPTRSSGCGRTGSSPTRVSRGCGSIIAR